MPARIRKSEFENFSWVYVNEPDHERVDQLKKRFALRETSIEDTLSASQRTKIEAFPDYIYAVLVFLEYNRNQREIKPIKVNVFISKKFLITVVHGQLKVLNDFFRIFEENEEVRKNFNHKSPERLLYEILKKLYFESMPVIDHIIADCDGVEKKIFSRKEKKMISEILFIRRNITDFRKIMQGHKDIVKKLIHYLQESNLFTLQKSDPSLSDLIDNAKEIWNNLDNLKERIEALQQTNESQISFRLSDIMKLLTVISVITFPITLIASIFGMNTLNAMPFIDSPFGFWRVIIVIFIIVGSMLVFFKYKKWL